MKISKLFHWLYASVMLMPIFAIGFKCLYVTFNPNAKESYYGETINQEQVNKIEYDNLVNSEIYTFTNLNTQTEFVNDNNFSIYISDFTKIQDLSIVTNNNIRYIVFFYYATNNVNERLVIRFEDNDGNYYYLNNSNNFSFSFRFISYLNTNLENNVATQFTLGTFTQTEYINYSYIDNVFYYSVDQIGNEPLFNWANNTFLSSPLLYITNLFGVPSTSPIITLLCFWFSVSIIWLVFDMLMYVPLLVHRWLDKGVLE